MRINKANKEKIEEITWGHAFFEGYSYDYKNRQIKLICPHGNRKLELVFNNVIYSELQSCSFWNGGYFFYDIGVMKGDLLSLIQEIPCLFCVKASTGHTRQFDQCTGTQAWNGGRCSTGFL